MSTEIGRFIVHSQSHPICEFNPTTRLQRDQRIKDMPSLPSPPVPQRLREMLKDYPEHIDRIQTYLNDYLSKPSKATPLFEQTIWALEGCLEMFIHEAQDELEAAQAIGEAEAIARANEKRKLMSFARSPNDGMSNLDEIWDYFEKHKAALK
ncbi:MAG: hypothetical protein ABL934_01505 [Lysobacteraceae bacterium]